ncbi:Avirulence (Avh) protein [Phytophthora cinnamomi]|uniref:Avirulence (Avh) protein n=1 Tax=Phytophthora cinnamomi TaxID=4785 RepID=UPI0035596042|nr:Avirulence (Avh) protein [Phytophthora cinnamomi]
MRLYHALLVAGVALLASNVQAECDKIMPVPADPSEFKPPSSWSAGTPVTQDSTPAPDVGASHASQGSYPSDHPVQQDSTANSNASGSNVGASQANQGSSDHPVQQDSTANSNASGSDTPSSDDDTPQGSVVPATPAPEVDASQANQGSGSDAPTSQDQGAATPTPVKDGVATPDPISQSHDGASKKTDVASTTTTKAPTIVSTPTPASNSSTPATVSGANSKLCAKPRVVVTEVDVGASVENNEDEAALKVIAIAALPSGGSRIAFQSGDNVIVRELDANDKLVSSSAAVKVPLHDFGDIYADKNGFVLVGTRDAEGGGTLNCGNPSNLCGTAPNPAVPCYDMYMVRYDGSKESWATKLTSSSASLPPYSSGKSGPNVYMIWWYAHHGRIAFDGTNWAAYFGAAISTSEGGCINIHQGDRMKVVSPSGAITDSKDSFDWGCSHSGYERITYDERSKSFATICKTDSNNRLMPPNNWDATIYPVNLAAADLGDIVPDSVASSNKYWSAVSNGDGDNAKVHLIHYDLKSKASEDIDGMLAMWEGSSSGGDLQEGGDRTIYAQVLDRATGKTISEKITVDKSVVGNRYQALKSYPDGSVAYLSKGKTDTSVQVVRFFGC